MIYYSMLKWCNSTIRMIPRKPLWENLIYQTDFYSMNEVRNLTIFGLYMMCYGMVNSNIYNLGYKKIDTFFQSNIKYTI